MDERHFRRMDKFDGTESKWCELAFQFKTQVGSVNPGARELLEKIQEHPKDPDWDDIFSTINEEEVKKMGAELYGLSVSLVTGGALTVVRGVAGGSGWETWHLLSARFDPITPARALRIMMTSIQPKKT